MSVSLGSAAVKSVTAIHTSVVMPVVQSVVLANITGSEPLKGCGRPMSAFQSVLEWSASVVIIAASMAEISLQAFTRHQYQRRRYTPPVPAPSSSTIFQPAETDVSCHATAAAANTRNAVANREALTKYDSLPSFFRKRR